MVGHGINITWRAGVLLNAFQVVVTNIRLMSSHTRVLSVCPSTSFRLSKQHLNHGNCVSVNHNINYDERSQHFHQLRHIQL